MDINEVFAGLHVLLEIVSLSQLRLDRKSCKLHRSLLLEVYTITVIASSTIFLLYELFLDNYLNHSNTNEIGQTVDFIQIVGIRLAHVVSITEAILRRKHELVFLDQVREVDRIFERSLNVNIDNGKFRQKTFQRAAIMFSIYLASELFILTSKFISSDQNFMLFWIFYLMPFLVCGLRYFQLISTIFIIKWRFDKLIHVLGEVNLVHDITKDGAAAATSIKMISHVVPAFDNAEGIQYRLDKEHTDLKRLLIMRDIYNRLWELTVVVNRCFGVSMLINVGNDFISITSHCYWIFLNFKKYSSTPIGFLEIAASVVWSIPHLFNLLVLAVTCERAVQSTTGIALSLHRIEIDALNDNHNTVVEQFSLQLLHQKIAFTAAGFFNIDCTLLYTIVGATTTYLIILIQFHLNEHAPAVND